MTTQQEYLLSWDEFHRDTRELARQLLQQHPQSLPWSSIVAIARGGLIPAGILARELEIRRVDSLSVASYDHDQQGELTLLNHVSGDGSGVLLVDDLVDSGNTARAVRELLPKATFVTVYAKPAARELTDYYCRDIPQQTWLHFPWDITVEYSPPLINR